MKLQPGQYGQRLEMGSTPPDRLDVGSEGAEPSSNCQVLVSHLGNTGREACPLHHVFAPSPPHCTPVPSPHPTQPLLRPGLLGAGCCSPWASLSQDCSSRCTILSPFNLTPLLTPSSSHFLQPLRVGSLVFLSSNPKGWAAAPMDRGSSSGSSPGDSLGPLYFPRHLALAPLSPSAGHSALLHAFPRPLRQQHPDPPVPCLSGELPLASAKPRLIGDKREPESLARSV